ncbi:MAG: nitrous oxide reductase family maturation protein NosD [Promethearchaeota archaeon]
MKSKTKFIISVSIIVMSFIFLGISTYFVIFNEENGENGVENREIPIYIDGSGTNNWNWASTQPWCQGSGTLADPYIIENLILDANGSESCILIKNSNVYFTIQNCKMFNALYGGIWLVNVHNCEILNNDIFNNSQGVKLDNCEQSYLFENRIHYNEIGIHIEKCGFTNISENLILNNINSGINITESGGIAICNNTLNFNCFAIAQRFSNYSWIYYNNINNNTVGLNLYLVADFQITQNILKSNNYYGMYIRASTRNLICLNEFVNNMINAFEGSGTNNQWNFTDIGNFWSDYSGVDADDDGIGDTPYLISGSTGSYDYYPIWDDGPN